MGRADDALAHHVEWHALGGDRERLAEIQPAQDDAAIDTQSVHGLFGRIEIIRCHQQDVGTADLFQFLARTDHMVGTQLDGQRALVRRVGNCNGLKAAGFGQLQRNVAQPADAEHRDLLARLWCGIPQATPRRIARAHHGRGIHVGKAVGQQDRTLRRDGDVLGMATLCGKAVVRGETQFIAVWPVKGRFSRQ